MPVARMVLGPWGRRFAVVGAFLLAAMAVVPTGADPVPSTGGGHGIVRGPARESSGEGRPGPGNGRGWGRPVASDHFTGRTLDREAWEVYDGPGHGGNGRRSPSAVTVRHGVLTITGRRDGTTGGIAWRRGARRYGRWEARIRMSRGCACYHPVLLLWPVQGGGGVSPRGGGGEIDYAETIDDGRRRHTAFYLHYGPEDGDRRLDARIGADLTRWHVFAVEWTPRGISGFMDGRRFFHTTDPAVQPSGPMGQTLQLDWFPHDRRDTARTVDPSAPATLQADWIRMYGL
ncbi:glycoside hydrolase family 16 protein [Actinomadura fibrosa]|uniref:Glycoside hydrolase family 16 protein n=1 Tax=Actinomadura fibrosa TaxID=111802 RepID=A0ABW2XY58_9ACTN|nr:glycoside hydrolase family 16 protein [Actinomadura fibrosa]